MVVELATTIKPETINFTDRKTKQTSFVDISNRGERTQVYKIKTTNQQDFKIAPVYFSLAKNEKKRVNVTYKGNSTKPAKQDRISVVFALHMDEKKSVEDTWVAHKPLADLSAFERKKHVKIIFKDDEKGAINEASAMQSVIANVSKNSQIQQSTPTKSQLASLTRDQDSYFALPASGPPRVVQNTRNTNSAMMAVTDSSGEQKRDSRSGSKGKKKVGRSKDASEETMEDGQYRDRRSVKKSQMKSVMKSTEASEETNEEGQYRDRRSLPKSKKKSIVPATDEEEETPPPKLPPKKKVPPLPSQPESDEMADAPVAPPKPRTKRKVSAPPPPEEEEETPPTKPSVNPPTRKKSAAPPPRQPPSDDVNEIRAEQPTQKETTKVAHRPTSPAPKQRRRRKSGSSSYDTIQSLLNAAPDGGGAKVIYIVHQDDNDDDSNRKMRKKKGSRKKSKKRREEEEEEGDE